MAKIPAAQGNHLDEIGRFKWLGSIHLTVIHHGYHGDMIGMI
jgi:hypothetical protein